INKTKYSDLVTKPSGDALDIGAGTWRFVTDEPRETNSDVAIVRWRPSQTVDEDWDQLFGDIYPKTEIGGQHTRYAAFRVKASFQGRSREYHAMFLFGADQQGRAAIFTADMIIDINGGALHKFLTRTSYPETLIEGGLGKDPVIYDWLASHQV